MSFYVPRLIWLLLNPLTLLLILLCLSLALQVTRWRRGGRRLMTVCVVALIVPAILPIGRVLTAVLENRIARPAAMPAQVDGIVVLGGMIDLHLSARTGRPVLNANAARLTTFVDLAKRYPDARLLFTGGSGALFAEDLREVDVAAEAMRIYGLDPARVGFEGRSRTTFENARFSYEMARPEPGETWLLVTSALHMPRALGTFRRAGWSVIPYPAEPSVPSIAASLRPRFDLVQGMRELYHAARAWTGLIAYRLMGRSDSLLPCAHADAAAYHHRAKTRFACPLDTARATA